MVLQLRFLGAFESVKLMEREKITMILPACIYSNVVGDDVIGDAGHGFLTNRAGDGGTVW